MKNIRNYSRFNKYWVGSHINFSNKDSRWRVVRCNLNDLGREMYSFITILDMIKGGFVLKKLNQFNSTVQSPNK